MLLFCVKTIMKEPHNFELAHLKKKKRKKKKKKKDNILAVRRLSGSVLFQCYFMPLGNAILFIMKTLKDEWYIVIKAYKFTYFEILRDFLALSYIPCPNYLYI